MKYREHRKTRDRISEIGFGSGSLFESGIEEGVRVLRRAYESGINYRSGAGKLRELARVDESAFPY